MEELRSKRSQTKRRQTTRAARDQFRPEESGSEQVWAKIPSTCRSLEDCQALGERVKGIEPSWPAWKAGALPLSYTRAWGVKLPRPAEVAKFFPSSGVRTCH